MRVEDRNVLEDFPGHADELRYDQAADGKHGDAPVLSFRTPTIGINARQRNAVKHRTVGAGNNLTVQNLYDPQLVDSLATMLSNATASGVTCTAGNVQHWCF